MKFMIAVDCDGPACVVGDPDKALSDSRDMPFAREQATREANAAACALFAAGATHVTVWDNHGFGANLLFDRLDRRCDFMLGTGFTRRFPGLDESYAGVLMIGYHAMEGTRDGVLAHTYSPYAFRTIRVNGTPVGEIALDSAVAGALGVPLLFLASDEKGCEEGLRFMPWIETVATKKGQGRNCAHSKHPAVVEEEIADSVNRAVTRLPEMRPFSFDLPAHLEIRYMTVLQALKARIRRRTWRLRGPRTIRTTVSTMRDWRC